MKTNVKECLDQQRNPEWRKTEVEKWGSENERSGFDLFSGFSSEEIVNLTNRIITPLEKAFRSEGKIADYALDRSINLYLIPHVGETPQKAISNLLDAGLDKLLEDCEVHEPNSDGAIYLEHGRNLIPERENYIFKNALFYTSTNEHRKDSLKEITEAGFPTEINRGAVLITMPFRPIDEIERIANLLEKMEYSFVVENGSVIHCYSVATKK